MLQLPASLQARFEKLLPVNGVPEKARAFHLRDVETRSDVVDCVNVRPGKVV